MANEKSQTATLYTRKAIQDAFLRIKRTKEYNTITVTDTCREAEALVYFQVNDCFAVSKRYSNLGGINSISFGPAQNQGGDLLWKSKKIEHF